MNKAKGTAAETTKEYGWGRTGDGLSGAGVGDNAGGSLWEGEGDDGLSWI